MSCSSCVQDGWLPRSRPEHARQLQNGHVTVKPELRATHVARRKLRYQKSFVAASWLPSDKQSELHIAEPAPTQPQPVRRCKTACHRASFVYVPVCLTICCMRSSVVKQNPIIAAVAVVAVILLLALRGFTRKSQAGKAQKLKVLFLSSSELIGPCVCVVVVVQL